jgi:hypothetical protein
MSSTSDDRQEVIEYFDEREQQDVRPLLQRKRETGALFNTQPPASVTAVPRHH